LLERANEDLDASGDAWLTSNEAISFERDDHLVDRWRADLKVALHIDFGRRASEHSGDFQAEYRLPATLNGCSSRCFE
jgi:hypothetical protein